MSHVFEAIRKIQQPSSDSCTAACVAMVCGDKDVDVDFHSAHYVMGEKSILKYLRERGVNCWRPEYQATMMPHRLGEGYVYLVQTPSLNYENAMHMVIVDYRTSHPQVIDPNEGREGQLAYTKIGHGVTDLRNWTVEVIVDLA